METLIKLWLYGSAALIVFTAAILWAAAIVRGTSSRDAHITYHGSPVATSARTFVVHGVGLDGTNKQVKVIAKDAAEAQKMVARQFLSLDGAVAD